MRGRWNYKAITKFCCWQSLQVSQGQFCTISLSYWWMTLLPAWTAGKQRCMTAKWSSVRHVHLHIGPPCDVLLGCGHSQIHWIKLFPKQHLPRSSWVGKLDSSMVSWPDTTLSISLQLPWAMLAASMLCSLLFSPQQRGSVRCE